MLTMGSAEEEEEDEEEAPSLRVPCQSATSECSPPLPGSDSAP